MSQADVEAYLREHIPLSAGMDIEVVAAGPGAVEITAPLEPNLNHRSTAFGGSVAALAILTGWTLVHLRLRSEGFVTHTVIQSSAVQYDAPIHESFTAVTESVSDDDWERFTRTLNKRGKGRIHVSVRVESAGTVAAVFTGAYVAICGQRSAGDA